MLYEAGPYTLARQMNDGRICTFSIKYQLCPTSTDIPSMFGVPDILHGKSSIFLSYIGSDVGFENRHAIREAFPLSMSETATITIANTYFQRWLYFNKIAACFFQGLTVINELKISIGLVRSRFQPFSACNEHVLDGFPQNFRLDLLSLCHDGRK